MLLPGIVAKMLLLGLMNLATGFACGQNYPYKPLRLVVPFAPGGGVDIVARGIAQKLTESLGRTVIVDNRSGAGGSLGAELTVHAAPDGYTFMLATASLITNALLYRVPYDPARDFDAITQVTAQSSVLITIPSVPAKTPSELIAYAKANPGRLNYASPGNGGLIHLTGELFQSMTGTHLVHVPYKGASAAYPDILAGRIQVAFPSIISVLPYLKSGKVRALAVTSRTRVYSLPEVPTLSESGVPGFDVTNWYGLLAPAGTPRAVIERLQRDTAALLKQPDVIARIAADGSEPVGSTSAQFTAHIRREIEKWGKVVRQAGITGE